MEKTISRFTYLLETVPPKLNEIKKEEWEYRLPNKWSKKEVLGHLLDSACNNHQRFLKAQFEILPFAIHPYNQNMLVAFNGYQQRDAKEIIQFWEVYNRHILHVIKIIPGEKLNNLCDIYDQEGLVTLAFLIEDYVMHMEHHLEQIITTKLD